MISHFMSITVNAMPKSSNNTVDINILIVKDIYNQMANKTNHKISLSTVRKAYGILLAEKRFNLRQGVSGSSILHPVHMNIASSHPCMLHT